MSRIRAAGMSFLAAALLVGGSATVLVSAESDAPSAAPLAQPTMPPAAVALPYPDGCAAYRLSTRRCDYIVAWAKAEAGYSDADQVTAELLGDPDCPDGSTDCHPNRTMGFVVRVRVKGGNGASMDEPVFCGITGGASLLCTDTPVIRTISPTTNGYRDTPCTGEAPEGCASPMPGPDPAARAAARPLAVPLVSVPIDHVGAYAVDVGVATLPNGILTNASFGLANASPADLLITPDGIAMVIDSLDGGPPFENIYEHGWRPGTERVRTMLRFTVESFQPGATLEVTDISVH